jgi:3'-phosphoadenosine 5'-phosphosulfate sulfotransferase (PAPS reductase)/FAD synthetase
MTNATPTFINTYAELVTASYAEFITSEAVKLGLVIDDDIARMIARGCPTVAGSSGGKDSDVLILLLDKLYNAVGYAGERVVMHADMGLIEHAESMSQVVKLAQHVGWQYKIVRRAKGDLIERYEQRWADNIARYLNLECVTVIAPWPSMDSLFCRSEVKVSPQMQEAVRMFPGQQIINAVGLRREESEDRKQSPISQRNDLLVRANGTGGRDWFPILDILVDRVWLIHRQEKFPWHVQYDRGNRRLSCAWCWLGIVDWATGAAVVTNHPSYIRMSALEILTGFSYAQAAWLCDTDPTILPVEMREQIEAAKRMGQRRREIEAHVPKHMLFKNHGGRHGWPSSQPTMEDCEKLARIRREMGELMSLPVKYTTAEEVYARYAELLAMRLAKVEKKAKAAERAAARKLSGRVVKVAREGVKTRKIVVQAKVQGEVVSDIPAGMLAQQPGGNYQPSLF